MNKYKVYLGSGTILTVVAEGAYVYNNWLSLTNGDNSIKEGSYIVVAQFAPGMWEGYQLLFPKELLNESGN